jgi:hypothetical protein
MSNQKETVALDQQYLEWSQFTNARTLRERKAIKLSEDIIAQLEEIQAGVDKSRAIEDDNRADIMAAILAAQALCAELGAMR